MNIPYNYFKLHVYFMTLLSQRYFLNPYLIPRWYWTDGDDPLLSEVLALVSPPGPSLPTGTSSLLITGLLLAAGVGFLHLLTCA